MGNHLKLVKGNAVRSKTGHNASAWTTDTLHTHLKVRHDDFREEIKERFQLLSEQLVRQWQEERRATDKALKVHDEALKIARESVSKAVESAFQAQRDATDVAQAAATERANMLTEWYRTLQDGLRESLGREEGRSAIDNAKEKIQDLHLVQQTLASRSELEELARRVAAIELMKQGGRERSTDARGNIALLITIVLAFVAVAGFIIAQ